MQDASEKACWGEIATADGAMGAFIARPTAGKAPALVMLSEIFGVNALMRETACAWATDGFITIAPDLFWRQQRGADLGYEGGDRERAFELYAGHDAARGAHDVLSAAAYGRSLSECDGRVFVLGYCFGGTLAWLAAAEGGFDGAACVYGTKIQDHLERASSIACPTTIHFGSADAHVPADKIDAIERAAKSNPALRFHRYEGAGHAFMNRLRPSYNRAAAQSARRRILGSWRESEAS